MMTTMTKKERISEVNKAFYEFCESKGFTAFDEGFGYWLVTPVESDTVSENDDVFSCNVIEVTRHNYEVFLSKDYTKPEILEFAKELEIRLEELQRMFNL
jgi:hypothetical protein